MNNLSVMASKLPPSLLLPAVRLEVAQTPEAHRALAEETQSLLARDNIDSLVVSGPDHAQSILIKPEPLDRNRPTNSLTSLSKALLKSGCAVHFHTGHYLSDIGAFNAVPKEELGSATSLSLPWVELQDNHAPLEALTLHEIRHFRQHQAREKARCQARGDVRPDIRVKFAERHEPDNWLGKQDAYNGPLGHSIDEVDAYLYQSKVHLQRAERKAKIDPTLAREDAAKAVTSACKAYLFADSDSKVLRMESPATTPIEGELRKYAGDRLLTENGAGAFVDSRDFPHTDILAGLHQVADQLAQDGRSARKVAGVALQLLSKDPGAVNEINSSLAQVRAVGWIK